MLCFQWFNVKNERERLDIGHYKKFALVLLLFIVSPLNFINAQSKIRTIEPTTLYYFRVNSGIQFNLSFLGKVSGLVEWPNNLGFGVEYSSGYLIYKNKPNDYISGLCFFGCGDINIQEYSAQIRKTFYNKNKHLKHGIELGISINDLQIPIFHKNDLVCFFCSNYDVCYRSQYNLGLKIKANSQLLPGRFFGMHFGIMANINSGYSYAGIELGWVFGKVRGRIIK
jgi:hypothetical protein